MIKQMMILIFAATVSPLAFGAAKPCENYAKYAAIKAYKAEMGTVQGSDGIGYTATPLWVRSSPVSYKITISDNNEDGETWTVGYYVELQVEQDSRCKILEVRKIKTRDDTEDPEPTHSYCSLPGGCSISCELPQKAICYEGAGGGYGYQRCDCE